LTEPMCPEACSVCGLQLSEQNNDDYNYHYIIIVF
jgi:uncharacterized protein (DUF983 family)